MLLRLQPLNCTIKYRLSKEMLLADTLSRLPSSANTKIELEIRIGHHGFTTERIRQISAETARDPILAIVHNFTQNGWPAGRNTSSIHCKTVLGRSDIFTLYSTITLFLIILPPDTFALYFCNQTPLLFILPSKYFSLFYHQTPLLFILPPDPFNQASLLFILTSDLLTLCSTDIFTLYYTIRYLYSLYWHHTITLYSTIKHPYYLFYHQTLNFQNIGQW